LPQIKRFYSIKTAGGIPASRGARLLLWLYVAGERNVR